MYVNSTPTYQQLRSLFSNDIGLKVLILLEKMAEVLSPTDVAHLLNVHISTAKKYLELFCDLDFVSKEVLLSKPGKPTYYRLINKLVSIHLDLSVLLEARRQEENYTALPDFFVREAVNIPSLVEYTLESDGKVKTVVLTKKTKSKRIVHQRITLSAAEKEFMKFLPHPTMEPESCLAICEKAGISGYYERKAILRFVEKTIGLGLLFQEIRIDHKGLKDSEKNS